MSSRLRSEVSACVPALPEGRSAGVARRRVEQLLTRLEKWWAEIQVLEPSSHHPMEQRLRTRGLVASTLRNCAKHSACYRAKSKAVTIRTNVVSPEIVLRHRKNSPGEVLLNRVARHAFPAQRPATLLLEQLEQSLHMFLPGSEVHRIDAKPSFAFELSG
jgi:hypothetical protein